MKKYVSKWSMFSIILMVLAVSCKNADVSPDDSVVGTYNIIINPILCSLPSMTEVKIKAEGSTFNINFNNTYTSKNEELTGVKVEKTDNSSKLFYKGKEIGSFSSMKYSEYTGSSFINLEGMVLMIRFDSDNKHYEFMGRK